MFNFDLERFLSIQSGAVKVSRDLGNLMKTLVTRETDNLFFMGSGGAGILMQAAADLMIKRSSLPCYNVLCAELVLTGHSQLGNNSIVIMPSLSGTTKESIAALEYAQQRGATVITLVGHADSPLAKQANHTFVNFAADDTSCESFYIQSLVIALATMSAREERDDYDTLLNEFGKLPEQLLNIKKHFEQEAADLAKKIQNDKYHIVTGAGNTWPEAFYYGMCILEEMQWIRTRPVHASDFFHGTLELVEKDTSIIVMAGEDESRALTDRVIKFAEQYTDRLIVLDTAQLPTEGLSSELRAMLAPAFLATMLERLSAHLEELRNHPLSTRRYYKRVAY